MENGGAFPATTPEGAKTGVIAIGAGGGLSAAAKADDSLIFWYNSWGDSQFTTTASNIGHVQALAAIRDPDNNGDDAASVLLADGSVRQFWGFSANPSSTNYDSGVTAITYAGKWLLAAKQDGTILFDGVPDPRAPIIPGGARALAAAYWAGALALRSDGTLVAWAPRDPGLPALAIPSEAQSDVVSIAAGLDHFLALKADGSVVAWGNPIRDDGQTQVPPGARSGVKAIAAGDGFSMALKADGTVVYWGYDIGSTERVLDPIQGSVTAIAAGKHQALALVTPRLPTILTPPSNQSMGFNQHIVLSVQASGPNLTYQWLRDGEEIHGATEPELSLQMQRSGLFSVVVSNPFGSVTSSPPAIVTVIPGDPGTVMAVGAGLVDRDSGFDEGQSLVPTEADGGVIAVAGGGWHSLALKADGSVIAWGGYTFAPNPDPAPARKDFIAIAAGWEHSLALTRDGTVFAWGADDLGQSKVPPGLAGQVIAIAANGYHSLALRRDGSVEAWGANNQGQRTVPPEARSGVIAIAAGGSHSLALKADGSVITWGANWSGQLDVPRSARHGVIAIAAGDSHSMALKYDGSVVAWGLNSTAGVETGQTDVPLEARWDVIAIAAGGNHSMALKSDGTVITWGHNDYGQNDVPDWVQGNVTGISAGSNRTLLILGTSALRSKLTPDGLELSWPASLSGFYLETSGSLKAGAAWTPVAESPSVKGDRRIVIQPLSGAPKWFRLNW